MKPWNQVAFQPAIGLMIDEQQIAMSVTVASLRGRRELARETAALRKSARRGSPQGVAHTVGRPDGSFACSARPWVRIGLPEARVFQAAVPVTPANRQHTPQNFFLEAVQVTNVSRRGPDC